MDGRTGNLLSTRNWVSTTAVACLLVSRTLHAQPTSTIHVESHIVLLDIAATDSQGHGVLDLRPDEFKIYEKNALQQVRSFEPPSAHALPADMAGKLVVNSTADLPKIGQAPITLLLLDELNMKFEDEVYERDKLIEWLGQQPAILPQPTALMAVTYDKFEVLRDFTQSRDTLLEILKKHTGGVLWRADSNGRVGSQASENMAATLGALEQVSQAMRGVPGRKNVIWIGNGFPSVNLSDVGRTANDEIEATLRHLSTVMLHARVTLSIIGGPLIDFHPVVIETQSDADILSSGGFDGLSIAEGGVKFAGLAPPTGGKAYGNSNDIAGELTRSVDGGSQYYTLSYRPSDPSNNPKEYRHIRVEVTRPGVTVQTRDGYFEEPPAPDPTAKIPVQQLAFDLYGAANSTMAYTDLHITAQRAGPEDFTLHAAAKDITWRELPDGRRHADLVILAMSFSIRNKMLAKQFFTLGSNTDASLAGIAQATPELKVHFAPPLGTARIRFVIRDMDGGRVGTADYIP
jgi:VWFA-related protein